MTEREGSIRLCSINAVDEKGRTALCRACKTGKYSEVKELLTNPVIDICLEDNSGLSPLEYAVKRNHLDCAALITDEAYRRLKNPNNEFLIKLRAELNPTEESTFDENLFRQSIENDPKAATKYLNQFAVSHNFVYEFKEMDKIFGVKNVKTSALASVLNDSILPSQLDEKLDCLKHPVLKRVLDIKWELFAAQKYYQQLILHILMLMALSNDLYSTSTFNEFNNIEYDEQNHGEWVKAIADVWVQPSFALWVFILVFCFFAFIHLRHLKPSLFLKLTRWMYDGKYEIQPNFVIPHAAVYKEKARSWLLRRTLLWTLFIVIPLVCFMKYVLPSISKTIVEWIILFNFYFTFIVVWLCALYFLLQEMQELLGEDPWIYECIQDANFFGKIFWRLALIFVPFFTPFMTAYRKYYASFTNKLQLVTFLLILGPYTIANWPQYFENAISTEYIAPFVTISLWMLSLQYLEVNKTAGYLLPVLSDVAGDAWDFLIIYGVFQIGITCAFYFIFRDVSEAYSTFWASFTSTYFVMYGAIGMDELTLGEGDDAITEAVLTFGYLLRMFQCAVMSILLINLLLAMMNKTVDRNWEKLQSRALTSYARAVLRLETMLGLNEVTRKNLMEISFSKGTSEFNPLFNEHISKLELSEQGIAMDNFVDDDEKNALTDKVNLLVQQNNELQKEVDEVKTEMKCQVQELKKSMHAQLEEILRITEVLGRTALCRACKIYEEVKKPLVDHMIDICLKDYLGLVPMEYALKPAEEPDFDENLFLLTIEIDADAAFTYLDQFVVSHNYDYEFKVMDKIFGTKNVNTSE
ncbi:hypothetical protein THRCLA_07842 [Thraustotheca clavata]|uniref:Uncharacterized protein n=1 Tax=Thraustotheca clavata TaxID=74557 RepID=A0A1V9ZBT9_9STRA|nr:hypothetical protein THRCLA_07842 [Thraustotheca clavata]